MPKEKDIDIDRLAEAIRLGRLSLRKPREERRELARSSTGIHWNDEGARQKVPFNLVNLYLDVVVTALISSDPRVMLSTFDKSIKPKVAAMETWANREIAKMELGSMIQRIIVDSLYSIGIAKVALGTPVDSSRLAWQQTAGSAFIEPIDLDDWVHEANMRDFRASNFMGHRYRAHLDVVKSFDEFDKKARKGLEPTVDQAYNATGDERISMLGRGYYGANALEFEDMLDLWEIYLPRHRLVITFAGDVTGGGDGNGLVELRRQRFIGPAWGPYLFLGYSWPPGNAMPIAPLQNLTDLHEFVNTTARKLMRQTDRQKSNLFVQGGAMEDGSRIQESNDGDIIRVDNPEKIKEVNHGGPDPKNFQMLENAINRFSYFADNLEMAGGLSPQSKTATQDKLLAENASRTMMAKQQRVLQFTDDVVTSLCWYWWNDPFKVMQTTYSLPGLPEFQVTRKVSPEDRKKVKFEELDIQVDPYSLSHQTPQQRLQMIDELMQKVLIPGAQVFQSQGIVPNLNKYMELRAKYANMPDACELVTFQAPPSTDTQQGGGPAGPGAPPPGQTEHIRNNVSTTTPQAQSREAINNMQDAAGSTEPRQ